MLTFFFFFLSFFVLFFRQRGREKETLMWQWNIDGLPPACPLPGKIPKPGPVPWSRMQQATFWRMGPRPTNWAALARAIVSSFKKCLVKLWANKFTHFRNYCLLWLVIQLPVGPVTVPFSKTIKQAQNSSRIDWYCACFLLQRNKTCLFLCWLCYWGFLLHKVLTGKEDFNHNMPICLV